MREKEITFLSSRKRGITIDLKLIQSHLADRDNEYTFRYYVGNERSGNKWVAKGTRQAKDDFCTASDRIICIDGSLSGDLKTPRDGSVKILSAVPYDYQFKTHHDMQESDFKKKKSFIGFSHIFVHSPFSRKVFASAYDLTGIELIDGLAMPFAIDINVPARQESMRSIIEYYFPQAKGKRIVSILAAGENAKDTDTETLFSDFSGEDLLNQLSRDDFLLTNSELVLNSMRGLSADRQDCFAFTRKHFPPQYLLYVSDALITNSAIYASYYASRRLPQYCLELNNSDFEKYMSLEHPSLYINSTETLLGACNHIFEYNQEQQLLNQELSYAPDEKLYQAISGLLS